LISDLEKDILSFTKDLAELKRIKIDFYLDILRKGYDCRLTTHFSFIILKEIQVLDGFYLKYGDWEKKFLT